MLQEKNCIWEIFSAVSRLTIGDLGFIGSQEITKWGQQHGRILSLTWLISAKRALLDSSDRKEDFELSTASTLVSVIFEINFWRIFHCILQQTYSFFLSSKLSSACISISGLSTLADIPTDFQVSEFIRRYIPNEEEGEIIPWCSGSGTTEVPLLRFKARYTYVPTSKDFLLVACNYCTYKHYLASVTYLIFLHLCPPGDEWAVPKH